MKLGPCRIIPSTSVFSPIQWARGSLGAGVEGREGIVGSVARPPLDKNGPETHEPKGFFFLFHNHREALERSPPTRRQVWQEGLSPCPLRGFQPLPHPGEPPALGRDRSEPAAWAEDLSGGGVG